MNKKQKRTRNRIVAALAIFAVVFAVTEFVPLAPVRWRGNERAVP